MDAQGLNPVPDFNSDFRNFRELFLAFGPDFQFFELDPGKVNVLVGRGGTRIAFPPDVFRDWRGLPVKGTVKLELREIFSLADMIFADRCTTSQSHLLESAGMLYIQAWHDNSPLFLEQPVFVEMPIQGQLQNPTSNRLYTGTMARTKAFDIEPDFDWRLVGHQPVALSRREEQRYLTAYVPHLGWFAFQSPFGSKKATAMVSVHYVAPFESLEAKAALLLFRGRNALVRMYPNGQKFTSFNMPAHEPATVLVIGSRQEQLFLGILEIEDLQNSKLFVQMHPVSDAELLQQIEGYTESSVSENWAPVK